MDKQTFMEQYVLARASVVTPGINLTGVLRDAEKAYDFIRRSCEKDEIHKQIQEARRVM